MFFKDIIRDDGFCAVSEFPQVAPGEIECACGEEYASTAALIVGKFFAEIESELPELTELAYAKFDGDPAPIVKLDDGLYLLELWHGRTQSHEDITLALSSPLLEAYRNKTDCDEMLFNENGICFVRVVSQIAYYFTAYADLVDAGQIKLGEKIDFCLPYGGYGELIAGYYAMRMGLPIGKLTCVFDGYHPMGELLSTGNYDTRKAVYGGRDDCFSRAELKLLVYHLCGENEALAYERMESLRTEGRLELSESELVKAQKIFTAGHADRGEISDTIAEFFDEYGYVLDPHTAAAAFVAGEQDGDRPTVVLSTATPHYFAAEVLKAIGERPSTDEMKNLMLLEDVTALEAPDVLIASVKKGKIPYAADLPAEEISQALFAFVKKLSSRDGGND